MDLEVLFTKGRALASAVCCLYFGVLVGALVTGYATDNLEMAWKVIRINHEILQVIDHVQDFIFRRISSVLLFVWLFVLCLVSMGYALRAVRQLRNNRQWQRIRQRLGRVD